MPKSKKIRHILALGMSVTWSTNLASWPRPKKIVKNTQGPPVEVKITYIDLSEINWNCTLYYLVGQAIVSYYLKKSFS